MTRVEHERQLLASALALLASGEARRITLVGFANGERLLREAAPIARAAGVVVRALRGRAGCDLALEPMA